MNMDASLTVYHERLRRLSAQAGQALGTVEEAQAFMATPHPELDGLTPNDALRSARGAQRVEQILNALAYGLAL